MSKNKSAPKPDAGDTAPAADTTPADAPTAADTAPRKRKTRVLAEAKRDGKTVRVLTDDVNVWKEID